MLLSYRVCIAKALPEASPQCYDLLAWFGEWADGNQPDL